MKKYLIGFVILILLFMFGFSIVSANSMCEPYDFDCLINQDRVLRLFNDTDLATGLDVSEHRGDLTLSFHDPLVRGMLDFIVLRVGYTGHESLVPMKDEHFEKNYKLLEKYPEILRGAYWYSTSFSPWKEQFDFFVEALEGKDFDFIALDFEDIYNEMSNEFGTETFNFLVALRNEYPDKRVFIYTHRHFYDEFLAQHPEIKDFPLWIANYQRMHWYINEWNTQEFIRKTIDWGQPALPGGRFKDDWEIWQFGDKTQMGSLIGLSTLNVDINITRRTHAEFARWIGIPVRWSWETIARVLNSEEPSNDGTRNDNMNSFLIKHSEEYLTTARCDYWVATEDTECASYPCNQTIDFTRVHGDLLIENPDNSFNINLLDTTISQSILVSISFDRVLDDDEGFYNDPFISADYDINHYSEGIKGEFYNDRYFSIAYQFEFPSVVEVEMLFCEKEGIQTR